MIASALTLAGIALLAWPGDAEERSGRLIGGFVLLGVVVFVWVQLRIFEDRRIAWMLGVFAAGGLLVAAWLGGDAVERIVLTNSGDVHTVEVVHVTERRVKGGVSHTYTLRHIDYTPVCGRVTTRAGDPAYAVGQFMTIVEDPECEVGPVLRGDTDYGWRLALGAVGVVFFAVNAYGAWWGYRRKCRV